MSWSKNCIISEIYKTPEIATNPPTQTESATTTEGAFQINSVKLFVPVVTLSKNKNMKSLEHLKQGFKRTLYCNKCRSDITTQPKNSNLDFVIDPTFRNVNRLFVLSFKVVENDPTRTFLIHITCHQ